VRVSLKVEKVVEIGRFLRLKCFVVDRRNFVLDVLINFEQWNSRECSRFDESHE